jgi:hypothetical protein
MNKREFATDLDREHKEDTKVLVPTPRVIGKEGIAEEVWNRQGRPEFAVRDFDSDSIHFVDEIETSLLDESGRQVTYVPADGPALRKGLVLLPRRPVETSFEETFAKGRELAHRIYDVSDLHAPEFDFLVSVAQASWFLDRFAPDPALEVAGMGRFAPIISLRGPSGHGKNRALSALRLNSYRPFYDQSTKRIPSLFRPLDLWRGTLCLDECDLGRSDEASDVVHYLNCRAYGTPISRQNPDKPAEAQAFRNFGLTIVTQRRAWLDDALENRSLPFQCERSGKELATTELDEWLAEGLDLQDRLLYLRLMFYEKVKIDKTARVPGLRDHRLTAAVLPILALREHAATVVTGLEETLRLFAKRRQEVRATSTDGVIINALWERLDAGLIGAWNGRPYVGGEKMKDPGTKEEVTYPLTTSELAEALKWRATDIRRVISSLQITPDDAPHFPILVGSRKCRAIFFNPGKLEVLLADFVPDYREETLGDRLKEFVSATGVKLSDWTPGTLGTDGTVPSPVPPVSFDTPPTQLGSVPSVPSVPKTEPQEDNPAKDGDPSSPEKGEPHPPPGLKPQWCREPDVCGYYGVFINPSDFDEHLKRFHRGVSK